jgi:CxxC motif-containing protein
MKVEEMVCIMCPLGCRLVVKQEDKGEINVSGNRCPRGIEYGKQEMVEPLRILTSSVLVLNGDMPLVSVKTNKPIPRRVIMQVMDILKNTKVEAPVRVGDVIIKDVLNTGADIVATRNVERREKSSTT